MPSFPDDDKRMSNTYKTLGLVWKSGIKKATPKKFRATIPVGCNRILYPMIRMIQLTEEFLDLLIFALTGTTPDMRPVDFGAASKFVFRQALRQQYIQKMSKNRSRLDVLSEEFDNLPMVCMRLGYPSHLLSPELRAKWERAQFSFCGIYSGAGANAVDGEGEVEQARTLPPKPALKAIADMPVAASDNECENPEETQGVKRPAEDTPTKELQTSPGSKRSRVSLNLPKLQIPKSLRPNAMQTSKKGGTSSDSMFTEVERSLAVGNAVAAIALGTSGEPCTDSIPMASGNAASSSKDLVNMSEPGPETLSFILNQLG